MSLLSSYYKISRIIQMRTSLCYLIQILLPLALIGLASCIHNDLPYPKIQQNIEELAASGESRTAVIDKETLTATVYLDEQVDIKSVSFDEFQVSEDGVAVPDLLVGSYDLSSPLVINITRFQTYQWLVKAVQNIERYFSVEGQIGEAVVDAVARRVIVNVPFSADIYNLKVTSIKLGPEGITTMVPDVVAGASYDFSIPFRIEVTAHGRSEEWTIYVERSEQLVSTDNVIPWSCVVWAYGSCPEQSVGGFRYKEVGEETWHEVDEQYIMRSNGSFSCYIPHLKPLTEYVVMAYAGEDLGNEVTVKTEATMDIPDGSFDQWWLKDDKIWCPWNEGGTPYWDTGNTGAATLGQSNVVPSDYTPNGQGKSAELNTKFVGIFGIGKLAAGSIYTGSFKKVDGTNGILDFGRPWSLHPTKLRGYFQYKTATIDYASAELEYLKGRPDSCHIYVALTDWTAPYEIRTNPSNRQLFDKDASYVLAYGELIFGGTMDSYQEFEIELKYRNPAVIPTYLQITCAASKYGDFFTGGSGAQLYVDQFSFDYDY